jgi:hypothetical protein
MMFVSSDLASGQKTKHVPYGAIKKDTESFTTQKYRPSGMILQDPRNMHLSDIQKVLQHCYGLQAEGGPELAFRFAAFIGPKRKHQCANYPKTSNTRGTESAPSHRKKKGKGKQREDPSQEDPLQGLLRIGDSVEPPASEHFGTDENLAGPSNTRIQRDAEPEPAGATHQHGMVRIGMDQMLQLREHGYEVMGPVNGPNEGYPEYEVPRTLLDMLMSQSQPAPNPNQVDLAGATDTADPAQTPIDPALLDQVFEQTGPTIDDILHTTTQLVDTVQMPAEAMGETSNVTAGPPVISSPRNSRPTTPPNVPGGPVDPIRNKTPKKRLGKRAQINLSPQPMDQTRRTSKRKKVTDDDLAALEAENMVQSGSKRRSKRTQRKQRQ